MLSKAVRYLLLALVLVAYTAPADGRLRFVRVTRGSYTSTITLRNSDPVNSINIANYVVCAAGGACKQPDAVSTAPPTGVDAAKNLRPWWDIAITLTSISTSRTIAIWSDPTLRTNETLVDFLRFESGTVSHDAEVAEWAEELGYWGATEFVAITSMFVGDLESDASHTWFSIPSTCPYISYPASPAGIAEGNVISVTDIYGNRFSDATPFYYLCAMNGAVGYATFVSAGQITCKTPSAGKIFPGINATAIQSTQVTVKIWSCGAWQTQTATKTLTYVFDYDMSSDAALAINYPVVLRLVNFTEEIGDTIKIDSSYYILSSMTGGWAENGLYPLSDSVSISTTYSYQLSYFAPKCIFPGAPTTNMYLNYTGTTQITLKNENTCSCLRPTQYSAVYGTTPYALIDVSDADFKVTNAHSSLNESSTIWCNFTFQSLVAYDLDVPVTPVSGETEAAPVLDDGNYLRCPVPDSIRSIIPVGRAVWTVATSSKLRVGSDCVAPDPVPTAAYSNPLHLTMGVPETISAYFMSKVSVRFDSDFANETKILLTIELSNSLSSVSFPVYSSTVAIVDSTFSQRSYTVLAPLSSTVHVIPAGQRKNYFVIYLGDTSMTQTPINARITVSLPPTPSIGQETPTQIIDEPTATNSWPTNLPPAETLLPTAPPNVSTSPSPPATSTPDAEEETPTMMPPGDGSTPSSPPTPAATGSNPSTPQTTATPACIALESPHPASTMGATFAALGVVAAGVGRLIYA